MDISLREHWFENAGVTLFAASGGDGQPIVLLHGGLANHLACWLYAEPLACDFQIITPDLRGAGRSHFAGPVSWDAIADDVAALVRTLELGRVIVGGMSFGAAAAVRVALRHPELVDALLVLHPAYGGAELGLSAAQQQAMAAIHAAGSRTVAEGIGILLPLFDALPPELRERARRVVMTYDPASVAATTAFMASGSQPFTRGADLARIAVPTLVVPGVDIYHPRDVAAVFREHLPNCTLLEADQPQLSTVIREFIGARILVHGAPRAERRPQNR
jgi:3-oxoadipate enol-lactonase